MTLTGRYSLSVDVGEACGIIFLGSWKLPEVGSHLGFSWESGSERPTTSPRRHGYLEAVREWLGLGTALPTLPFSGRGVLKCDENSSAGGESRLQEWAALDFSLSVSFRKAIFSPSKWIIATKMTFLGEEELKYGSHFLASPKGQRETIKHCSSSKTVF